MKPIRNYLEEWAEEFDRRRGIQHEEKSSPYVRDPQDIDAFCKAERHKECMSPTCGCACHTKDEIMPLSELLNPKLFR